MKIIEWLSAHRKAMAGLLPFLAAGGYVILQALTEGHLTANDWRAALVAVVSAVLVYAVPNKPSAAQKRGPSTPAPVEPQVWRS
jgi:hypothetical protein